MRHLLLEQQQRLRTLLKRRVDQVGSSLVTLPKRLPNTG
jgi:hypothetical protein